MCHAAHCSSTHTPTRNHAMIRTYFHIVYNAVRQNIMRNSNKDLYWTYDNDTTPSYLVDFVQIIPNGTATKLKRISLISYPRHIFLMNGSVSHGKWLIKNGLSSIRFLPTRFEVTVESGAWSQLKNDSARYWFRISVRRDGLGRETSVKQLLTQLEDSS